MILRPVQNLVFEADLLQARRTRQFPHRLEKLCCLHFLNFLGNLLFIEVGLLLTDDDLLDIFLVAFAGVELMFLIQFLFLGIPYQQAIILAVMIRRSSLEVDLSEHLLVSFFIPSHVLLIFI